MTMALFPTSELVAKAWILGLPGVPSGAVATTLPEDTTAWLTGFVQVTALNGSPQLYMKKREIVLDVTCWYQPPPASNNPPWNKAAQLAEKVFDGGYADALVIQRLLTTLPAAYDNARVLVFMPSEVEKRGEDDAGNAAFGFNAEMHWIAVPK